MFIRTTRVKRGDKVYEYPQLVESYRRKEDGRPAHKVLYNLKDMAPEVVEALKVALAAGRSGDVVVPYSQVAEIAADRHAVVENLDYLPLAVFAALWKAWGLTTLLDRLLPSDAVVAHSRIILALVLHRCVAPASKLAACRWFPRTALPELLGVETSHFNNSRVHRALDAFSQVEDPVQDALGQRVVREPGGVVATYLDLTDTWFVGRGPELARRGETKEGLVRKKVGIALLCDQRGYPLRWKTVEGTRNEAVVMKELLGAAAKAGTLRGQPVVMDRAMGHGCHVDDLHQADVAYVTALARNDFVNFVPEALLESIGDVDVSCADSARDRDIERLSHHAEALGMEAGRNGRLVMDLGVRTIPRPDTALPPFRLGPNAELLREVAEMDKLLRSKGVRSTQELAERYGCSTRNIQHYLELRGLSDAVRKRVLAGETETLNVEELRVLAKMDEAGQEAALDELLAVVAPERPRKGRPPKIFDARRHSLPVRVVISFDPERFIDRRAAARRDDEGLRRWVDGINDEERGRAKPRKADHLLSDVRLRLQKMAWLDLYEVTTQGRRQGGRTHHEVVLTRNDAAWARRRRADGVAVIVAHPSIPATAPDLLALYAAKDMVEKDFHIIKSELDLRPVRHRTDLKVSAHVSLCMLALLLQRIAEARMLARGVSMTAAAAIEELETCHLNRVEREPLPTYYTVTRPTLEQLDILRALDLECLVDEGHVGGTITPR